MRWNLQSIIIIIVYYELLFTVSTKHAANDPFGISQNIICIKM